MSGEPWRAWIQRAESNLARARLGRQSEDILYEDICFDAQQAAEKALKGLLVHSGLDVPRTHSVGYLLSIIKESSGMPVPPQVEQAALLSDYAVTTRYPGDWEPVGEDEYKQALAHAEEVWNWVVSVTGHK